MLKEHRAEALNQAERLIEGAEHKLLVIQAEGAESGMRIGVFWPDFEKLDLPIDEHRYVAELWRASALAQLKASEAVLKVIEEYEATARRSES